MKTKLLLLLLLLVFSEAYSQLIWTNAPTRERDQNLQEIIIQSLGETYNEISSSEKVSLYNFIKSVNPHISDFNHIKTNQYVYLEFPAWLKARLKNKEIPKTVVVNGTVPETKVEEAVAVENESWIKKYSPQIGIGLNSSFVDEFKGERRFETIKSDAIQLRGRGEFYLDENKQWLYIPQLGLAKASQTINLPLEIELKNSFVYFKENKWNVFPLASLTISKNSHLYVLNSLNIGKSDDYYSTLNAGAIYMPVFFEKNWTIAATLNYTPYYHMNRQEVSDKTLSGPGAFVGLGTMIFEKFNLEFSSTYSKLKNTEITLKRSEILTSLLYKF